MDRNYQIGNFILERRQRKGLTQRQVAAALDVSNRTVSSWESGTSLPRLKLLEALGELLDTTPAEILAGRELGAQDRSVTYSALREQIYRRCESCGHTRPRLIRPGSTWTCSRCGAGLQAVPLSLGTKRRFRFPIRIAALGGALGLLALIAPLLVPSPYLPTPDYVPQGCLSDVSAVYLFARRLPELCYAVKKTLLEQVLDWGVFLFTLGTCGAGIYLLIAALLSRFLCKPEITSYPYPDPKDF